MKRTVCLLCCMTLTLAMMSQDLSLYKKHLFIKSKDTLPYRVLLPENYDRKKNYPLIIFLHGAGERGVDNEKQLIHGAGLFLKEEVRKNFPAIVIFPQCPEHSYWSNVDIKVDNRSRIYDFKAGGEPTFAMKMLQELLQKVLRDYPVQRKKVYVGGLSMGGMGTFEIVGRNPKLFAAAFPICGGGAPSIAPELSKVNWWIFHGGKDDVIQPEHSERMVNALRAVNAKVKFTLYPNANHNSWDPAFAEPELLPWLFSQEK